MSIEIKLNQERSNMRIRFLNKLRIRIGTYVLLQRVRKQSRVKGFYNFDNAKTIGVVFDASQQNLYLQARSFIYALRKRDIAVEAIGYVQTREAISYFSFHEGITFFSINHNNWYYMPLNPDVQKFVKMKFDLLIDLSLEDALPLRYIVGLTNAKLKLGSNKDTQSLYDFFLNIQSKDLNFYITQIKHYMSVIKCAS